MRSVVSPKFLSNDAGRRAGVLTEVCARAVQGGSDRGDRFVCINSLRQRLCWHPVLV